MRMTILFRWLATLWFAGLIIFSAGQLAAQTEEKLLDDINQLPEAERQARLVDSAKKEGTVTWYVAMNRAYAQDLINAFEAQYPFLKVNALTGGAERYSTVSWRSIGRSRFSTMSSIPVA